MTRMAAFLTGCGFVTGLNSIILPLILDLKVNLIATLIAIGMQLVASLLWAIAYYRKIEDLRKRHDGLYERILTAQRMKMTLADLKGRGNDN